MIAITIRRNTAPAFIERLRWRCPFRARRQLIRSRVTAQGGEAGAPPLLEFARESIVPRFNEFYLNLNQNYLFAEIRRRTKVYTDAHPGVRLVDLGVGDVTQPLPPAVVRAIHEAADDMASSSSGN